MEPDNLIAIIRDVDSKDVVPIVEVLIEEGITNIEVSLSDEEKGLQCIEKLVATFDKEKLYLGAGTVLNERQMNKVLNIGAQYIITPGWNKELIKIAVDKQIEIYPGVYSPGEIAEAMELGLKFVKLFPINGASEEYIKALRGPFPNIKIIGVGGINPTNIPYYQGLKINYFGIGSDLIPRGATKKDLEVIRKNANEFKNAVKRGE